MEREVQVRCSPYVWERGADGTLIFLTAGRGVALTMMYLDREDFKWNSLTHLHQFTVPLPSISTAPDNLVSGHLPTSLFLFIICFL